LEISISKKYFKLAVERNKIKRQIKEIFRSVIGEIPVGGVIVFSVFRPYGELSYKSASLEIASAIKKFSGELDLK
jgi:ribonuclease P protein component